jgi:hypothetical protein
MKLETAGQTAGRIADQGIHKTAVATGKALGWLARNVQKLSDKMTVTTVIELKK